VAFCAITHLPLVQGKAVAESKARNVCLSGTKQLQSTIRETGERKCKAFEAAPEKPYCCHIVFCFDDSTFRKTNTKFTTNLALL
jgi:hypothetical protein